MVITMKAKIDLSEFDIELGAVFESVAYVNGERTDRQETDDQGVPAWRCDLTFYAPGGAEPLMQKRVKVFQADKPSVSTRHGLVELPDAYANFYGRDQASIWAWGIKEVRPTAKADA